ncbi:MULTISPECIES: hypothetical protein [unclassified Nocardia]|uniref:hypothetical protein n=1 Tax=unclassified Nocardia TaxID=2637762 RepID=UPI00278C1395|nr:MULTISPECIES: hypothetical protein [unclassified Nocardia]
MEAPELMSGRYSRVVSVVFTGLLAAACTGSGPDAPIEPGPSVYTPPAAVRNATVIWSAESGIDLFDTFPTLTRAAMEALEVAERVAGPELSYPGFDEAVTDERQRDLHFRIVTGRGRPIFGTLYRHILEIVPTDTGFTAYVCAAFKDYAIKVDGGYNSSRSRTGSLRAIALISNDPDYRPPTPDPSKPAVTTAVAPPSPPPGPPVWQAPEENLFRGWTVDLNPPGELPDERCAPWMATIDPDAPAEHTPVRSDEPPETLPAYPGWSRYRH